MARRIERRQPATYDDVRQLPEHLVGELIDGELFASPRPTSLHANAATELAAELNGPFRHGRGGPGGWIILLEPELHVVSQVMVPDLAGWRRERMPALPDVAVFELAPDWVCEVVSPTTASVDRKRKMPHYARAGVGHLWLVDPGAQTLEVYRRLEPEGWQLLATFAESDKVRAEPFAAVEIDLALLWAR